MEENFKVKAKSGERERERETGISLQNKKVSAECKVGRTNEV
jgi:hypothetical protein